MVPKLYMAEISSPSRAVMMTAEALGLKLEYIHINIWEKQHMTQDYIMKNPQHTIPMLEDEDYIVWDSHAIAAYLVTVYGKDDSLYPKDPKKRAIVDQRLHFDSSVIFPKTKHIIYNATILKEFDISRKKFEEMVEVYSFLEAFLENKKWLAGDHLTIADLCCSASISMSRNVIPLDSDKFPLVTSWFNQMLGVTLFRESKCKRS